jgi:hypothetical protein
VIPAFTPKGRRTAGSWSRPRCSRSIGDVLTAHNIPWKHYGGRFNADGQATLGRGRRTGRIEREVRLWIGRPIETLLCPEGAPDYSFDSRRGLQPNSHRTFQVLARSNRRNAA